MKNRNQKLLYFLFSAGLGLTANAQVGIGNKTPNPSTQLEITATDRGVLFPRVALKSIVDKTTITAGNVNSLFVFNTATTEGTDGVHPGYYYWYVDRWVRLATGEDLGRKNEDPFEETLTSISQDKVAGTITYIDERGALTVLDIKGLKGDQGDQGIQGLTGADGKDGKVGIGSGAGAPGQAGTPGAPGKDINIYTDTETGIVYVQNPDGSWTPI
ncbi:hypothetical protein GJU42_20595, partial [Flavobacterium resistens]|nr:hypothetical protein [Flavobacterium resistens]